MQFWQELAERYSRQRRIYHESRGIADYQQLIVMTFTTAVFFGLFFYSCLAVTRSQDDLFNITGIKLQAISLAPNQLTANAILRDLSKPLPDWTNPTTKGETLADRAKAILHNDNAFIIHYLLFFVALASVTCTFAYNWTTPGEISISQHSRAWLHWSVTIGCIFLLGAADRLENLVLEEMLDTFGSEHLSWLRFFAQLKFILLTAVGLGILTALAVGLRREIRFWTFTHDTVTTPNASTASAKSNESADAAFRLLVGEEHRGIARGRLTSATEPKGEYYKVRQEAAGEPWLYDCKTDFVGLALSGGGIRSATFNLGLLQGLHRLNLLNHFDYLTTVSGGGYIGSFWSRWLSVHSIDRKPPDEPFPDKYKESQKYGIGDSGVFEAEEIRHIREFSKFLVPRTGIFDTETWGAIIATLAGVIPGLLGAVSVLGLSLTLWLALTFQYACPELWARTIFSVCFTALILVWMELWWRWAPTGNDDPKNQRRVEIRTWVALGLVGLIACFSPNEWKVWAYQSELDVWYWKTVALNYQNWWVLLGIVDPTNFAHGKWIWIPGLYYPTIGWITVAAIFIACRFRGVFSAPSMNRRTAIPTNDRVAMRLLGLATSWAALATLWHIGLNLKTSKAIWSYLTGGTAVCSTGLFALLRNWFSEELSRPQENDFASRIKAFIPQVLAYLAIGLAWATVASVLIASNQQNWMSWYLSLLLFLIPIVLILLADPHEFGLHAIYRDRICRAFLGAAMSSDAAQNRMTDLQASDDAPISDLLERPLHLVCCAANNVGGDHLSTLSRGARSAVLSRNGIAMGGDWLAQPKLSLGSAVTASAAAANSNMGSLSMSIGPAVSFLMTALNIRLGLWVDNPKIVKNPPPDRLLPGWRYFKEMAAWTDTSASDIHLSDGGHFDNLGLYELVRRHCRYIIVSDATADPDIAFDDLGNTTRRIREDFGIEIEIDIEPLKPGADGRSRQHAVVGTIHYGWFDKGNLVYVKPSLTGDEPVDTTQYKSRNSRFPHESTGDQFYDEAQWESYRKLGLHCAQKIFAFVEDLHADGRERIQTIFEFAKQTWYPAPPTLADAVRTMSEHFTGLEEELRSSPPPIYWEIFPELDIIPGASSKRRTDYLGDLSCLLRVQTLMENTVLACSLKTHWNHPLNLGWVNLFARWATSPTFRMWWPVLRPMYSPDLRNFLEDRFEVLKTSVHPHGKVGWVESTQPQVQSGLAYRWWSERDNLPDLSKIGYLFEYRLSLPPSAAHPERHIQVGLAAIDIDHDGTARWSSDQFFVPLSLWGSGIGTAFLHALLKELHDGVAKVGNNIVGTSEQPVVKQKQEPNVAKAVKCRVEVKGPDKMNGNKATWDERQGFVEFYRQAGFLIQDTEAKAESDGNWTAILTKDLG